MVGKQDCGGTDPSGKYFVGKQTPYKRTHANKYHGRMYTL